MNSCGGYGLFVAETTQVIPVIDLDAQVKLERGRGRRATPCLLRQHEGERRHVNTARHRPEADRQAVLVRDGGGVGEVVEQRTGPARVGARGEGKPPQQGLPSSISFLDLHWRPMTRPAISARPIARHVIDTHSKPKFLEINGNL